MKRILCCGALLACAACASAPAGSDTTAQPEPQGKVYHVYYLGGQSNMEGFGFNAELPDALKTPRPGIRIFQGKVAVDGDSGGGAGLWSGLQPGHGLSFDTDGEANALSDRFGPELSFGHAIAAAHPDRNIALIKYSRGGSALVHGVSDYGSWDPDYAEGNKRNQYDNALTAISGAFAADDIDGDGAADRLIPAGIVWMQGESDAYDNEAAATNYAANLKRLMGLLRAALHADDLPIVIGRIKDSGDTPETRKMALVEEVQAQQAAFAAADACAAMTTVTEDFAFLDDGWHYVSADYVRLGEAFAEAMAGLEAECSTEG